MKIVFILYIVLFSGILISDAYGESHEVSEAISELTQVVNSTADDSENSTEQGIASLGPYLAAMAPLMAAAYAGVNRLKELRVKGMEMSSNYEKEMTEGIRAIVEDGRRHIYKEVIDNQEYYDSYINTGKIPSELARSAFQDARRSFEDQYLTSSRLTRNARERLAQTSDLIIRQYVTENTRLISERVNLLINKNVPQCIQSSLLQYKNNEITLDNYDDIIDDALHSLNTIFDYEQILIHPEFARVYLKAELFRILNAIEKQPIEVKTTSENKSES